MLNVEQIVDEVKTFIEQSILLGVGGIDLGVDDSFLQKGVLDSTGVLELVAFLEERYKLTCKDGEITPENLDCLNAIAGYVRRKQQEPESDGSAAS